MFPPCLSFLRVLGHKSLFTLFNNPKFEKSPHRVKAMSHFSGFVIMQSKLF